MAERAQRNRASRRAGNSETELASHAQTTAGSLWRRLVGSEEAREI